jgi:hypothetical protein
MSRTHRNVFAPSSAQHYVVVWNLQWQVIDCRRLPIGCDLRTALTQSVELLQRDGWKPEGSGQFGFAFLTRAKQRRLIALTARDPFNPGAQSFSPFGPGAPR